MTEAEFEERLLDERERRHFAEIDAKRDYEDMLMFWDMAILARKHRWYWLLFGLGLGLGLGAVGDRALSLLVGTGVS